jgi:hypothetical protein
MSLDIKELGMDRILLKLDDIALKMDAAPKRVLDDASDIMVGVLRAVAPKRTGALAAEVYSRVEGLRATFWDRKFYTKYVLHGTMPHVIRPRTARALYWPGARHPVTSVFHPGTRPNPFNREAFRLAREPINFMVERAGGWIVGL